MSGTEIAKFVLDLLGGMIGPLYTLIKTEIDGGADAKTLREKKWELYVSFGGGEGDAVVEQRSAEDEMLNPDQD
jgi:hypothetical protein